MGDKVFWLYRVWQIVIKSYKPTAALCTIYQNNACMVSPIKGFGFRKNLLNSNHRCDDGLVCQWINIQYS